MQVFENLLTDRIVQICLHVFEDKVEIFIIFSLDHIVEFDYIGVV